MLLRYRFILINTAKRFSLYSSTASIHHDSCTGCEIPCTEHVSYPPEILKTIDQGTMINSVEKHRRHLCIGQPFSSSQWPKHIKDISGGYVKELLKIFKEKENAIGYPVKLTSASIPSTNPSDQTADWYLFPDQIKLNNVHLNHIEDLVDKLFINDQSIIKIKNQTNSIEEQLQENNSPPEFHQSIQCERLSGIWMLVCCHQQRDQRCGTIGPILVDEIEKHVRKTNHKGNIHCLKISHIGGHRFAGNIIIYPSGVWYGRVLTCHIPLLVDAYTSSSSKDLKERLKPLLRGYLDTTS